MSELEAKPDKPPKPGMSLRSVATITGAVVGTAGAVTLLAVGGWIAVAGGTVAVVGAGYTRHRMKNPRRPSGRRSTNGGKLSWPLTGNQSRRGLLGSGSNSSGGRGRGRTGSPASTRSRSAGRKSGKGLADRAGSLLPKTTRSRARAGAGGVLPKHKASRGLPSRTTPKAGRSAGVAAKPRRLPKTPTRTPAKPGSASRLMAGKSSAHRKPGSPSSTRKGSRSPARGKGSSLLPKASTRGRSSTRRPSSRGQSGGGLARRLTSPKKSGSGRRSLNPLKRTSPSGLHSRTRNPLKRTTATPGRRHGRTTRRARRLGTPGLNRTANRSPSRSVRRPKTFKRTRARKLFRLAVGLPVRKGSTFKRPSLAQRRKARRTLWLRGITRTLWLRKLPGIYSRWHWDRIQARIPQTPNPAWRQTTIPLPKVKTEPGPRHAIPATSATSSPTTTEVPKMSADPHGVIAEAFNQLAQFQPGSASEMERYLAMQHELFTNIGMAYTVLADRMSSDMPFGPAVADSTRDLGAAFSSLSGLAQDVHATFRQEHEAELARIEAPRPNEQIWDTNAQ